MAGTADFLETSKAFRDVVKDLASNVCILGSLDQENADASDSKLQLLSCTCEQLLSLGTCSADIIASSMDGPKEIRSFAVLNMCWTTLLKLMLSVPQQQRSTCAESLCVDSALLSLLKYLSQDFQLLMTRREANRLQVVRFWLQHVTKIASGFPASAFHGFQAMADLASAFHECLPPLVDTSAATDAGSKLEKDVQDHVIGRFSRALVAALAGGLEESIEDVLNNLTLSSPAQSPESSPSTGESSMGGRLMLCCDLMLQASCMPPWLRLAFVRRIMPWAVQTCTVDHYHKALQLDGLLDAVRNAVLVLMLASSAAAAEDQDVESWQECQMQLLDIALKRNPLTSFLWAEIWALIVAASSQEAALDFITSMWQVLKKLATSSVIQNPATGGEGSVWSLAFVLGRALQACPDAVKKFVWDNALDESSLEDICSVAATSYLLRSCPLEPGCIGSWAVRAATAAAKIGKHCLRPSATTAEEDIKQPKRHCCWLLQCLVNIFRHPGCAAFNDADCVASLRTAKELAIDIIQADAGSVDVGLQLMAVEILSLCSQSGHGMGASIKPALTAAYTTSTAAAISWACMHMTSLTPPPADLYHRLLHEEHWALQHQAMESLVGFSRLADCGHFQTLVPGDVHTPGSDSAFIKLMNVYLKRKPALGSEHGAKSVVVTEGAALRRQDVEGWGTHVTALRKGMEGLLQALRRTASREGGSDCTIACGPVDVIPDSCQTMKAIGVSLDRLERNVSVLAAHRQSLDEATKCHVTSHMQGVLQELQTWVLRAKTLEAQLQRASGQEPSEM
eukprot:evm.model.scf_85EXC.11 EVM.evm.TU.scf_85EXC.11   scf_85EXC:67993-74119(-)